MSNLRYLRGSIADAIRPRNFYGTRSDFLTGEAAYGQLVLAASARRRRRDPQPGPRRRLPRAAWGTTAGYCSNPLTSHGLVSRGLVSRDRRDAERRYGDDAQRPDAAQGPLQGRLCAERLQPDRTAGSACATRCWPVSTWPTRPSTASAASAPSAPTTTRAEPGSARRTTAPATLSVPLWRPPATTRRPRSVPSPRTWSR